MRAIKPHQFAQSFGINTNVSEITGEASELLSNSLTLTRHSLVASPATMIDVSGQIPEMVTKRGDQHQ
jgi:hypothetical protein